MEIRHQCVCIFLLNILVYCGRIDYVFCENINDDGSATGSDGYAKNVENANNEKRTINTLKKINNGKSKRHDDLHRGARQVMHTITSKLLRHAGDKISKHVRDIIRSSVANRSKISKKGRISSRTTIHKCWLTRCGYQQRRGELRRGVKAGKGKMEDWMRQNRMQTKGHTYIPSTLQPAKALRRSPLTSTTELVLPAPLAKPIVPLVSNITLPFGHANVTLPVLAHDGFAHEPPIVRSNQTAEVPSANNATTTTPAGKNASQGAIPSAEDIVGIINGLLKNNDSLQANITQANSSSPINGSRNGDGVSPARESTSSANITKPPTANNLNATFINSTALQDGSLSIKVESDSTDAIKPMKYTSNHPQTTSPSANSNSTNVVSSNTTTTNATNQQNATQHSDIYHPFSPVSSFVEAPPIGPMESINIAIKGSAATYKNFTKEKKDKNHDFRPSKTILNFENNSVLNSDNILKRHQVVKTTRKLHKHIDERFAKRFRVKESNENTKRDIISKVKGAVEEFPKIILYEGPISKELESMLMAKRSPSKAVRSAVPFKPISSSAPYKFAATVTKEEHAATVVKDAHTTKRSPQKMVKHMKTKGHESSKLREEEEDEEEDEDITSGESGDSETKAKAEAKKKVSVKHDKFKKHSGEKVKKILPIKKVPILVIKTSDESVKTIYPKVNTKMHRHNKSEIAKKRFPDDLDDFITNPLHHKKKHRANGSSAGQRSDSLGINRYNVSPGLLFSTTAGPTKESYKSTKLNSKEDSEDDGSAASISLDLSGVTLGDSKPDKNTETNVDDTQVDIEDLQHQHDIHPHLHTDLKPDVMADNKPPDHAPIHAPLHGHLSNLTATEDHKPTKTNPSGKTIHGYPLEPATFTLGHNTLDELPKNLPEKGPLHAGHNHPGDVGIDHDLPQDRLVAGTEKGPLLPGHEQGPLLPGHEKGPLLPEQNHPGEFPHHEKESLLMEESHYHGDGLCPPCYDDHSLQHYGPSSYNNGSHHDEPCEPCHHHTQPSGPIVVEEPLQVPPVPAETNPGIPNAVHNHAGAHLHPTEQSKYILDGMLAAQVAPHDDQLHTPSLSPDEARLCAINGAVLPPAVVCPTQHIIEEQPIHHEHDYPHTTPEEVPLHNPHATAETPLHHDHEFDTTHHPSEAEVRPQHATEEPPLHHEHEYTPLHAGFSHEAAHHVALPTLTPTLPFEIPPHHKFEGLGHNIEPELLSIIEGNSQQVTSLSHEVKNIESRLANVETQVELLEKAVYRMEEKMDKLDSHLSEAAAATVVPQLHHSPSVLKQFFVPISTNSPDAAKDVAAGNGQLPWPVNKVVSMLVQELQKNKHVHGMMTPIQLRLTNENSHMSPPVPQPDVPYPPKEHDIDRLEYELGRTPKNKFGHKTYHYEPLEQACQCENGGECNGRSECDCPLRFTGPRCERPVPRSSLLDNIMENLPPDAQAQFQAPKKTSLITLPLMISENSNDDQEVTTQKTVGEVNQSKLVNLLSQFFSPDYLQRFAKREQVSQRRYIKYPLEKENI